MNDESRALRQKLAKLCDSYNHLISDKDTVDFRLGSHEPYAKTVSGIDPERIYEAESTALSEDVRQLIIAMLETGNRIREIEGF